MLCLLDTPVGQREGMAFLTGVNVTVARGLEGLPATRVTDRIIELSPFCCGVRTTTSITVTVSGRRLAPVSPVRWVTLFASYRGSSTAQG